MQREKNKDLLKYWGVTNTLTSFQSSVPFARKVNLASEVAFDPESSSFPLEMKVQLTRSEI